MSKRTAAKPQQKSNLYRFIRLVLGNKVTDSAIADKWKMNNKNFSEFKYGRYPVPRLARLVSLSKILKVDDHLVYEVAKGNPAERVYKMITNPAERKKFNKKIIVRYTTGKLVPARNPLNI